MWLNSRSRSNGHARTRLGRSLTGWDGPRSILITILPLLTHSGVGEVTGLLLPDAAGFRKADSCHRPTASASPRVRARGGLVAGQPIQPLLDFFGAGLAEDAGYHAVFGVEEGGSRRSAWTFRPLASRNVRAALGASAHGASTDASAVRGTSRPISPCAPWQAGGRCSSAAKRNRRTRRGHARRVSCRERRGCGRGRPAAEESCPTPLPGWME